MKPDDTVLLLFKIVLIADLVSLVTFVAVYTKLAPWWRSPVGQTLVIKDILLGLALMPSILSLFFQFSRLTSQVAAWFDIGLFALIALVVAWRTVVWQKIHHDHPEG